MEREEWTSQEPCPHCAAEPVTITGFFLRWASGQRGRGTIFPLSFYAASRQRANLFPSMISLDPHSTPGVKWGRERGDRPGVTQLSSYA